MPDNTLHAVMAQLRCCIGRLALLLTLPSPGAPYSCVRPTCSFSSCRSTVCSIPCDVILLQRCRAPSPGADPAQLRHALLLQAQTVQLHAERLGLEDAISSLAPGQAAFCLDAAPTCPVELALLLRAFRCALRSFAKRVDTAMPCLALRRFHLTHPIPQVRSLLVSGQSRLERSALHPVTLRFIWCM